ncbi:unnamed protein product [Mucor hiemalis]
MLIRLIKISQLRRVGYTNVTLNLSCTGNIRSLEILSTEFQKIVSSCFHGLHQFFFFSSTFTLKTQLFLLVMNLH